MKRTKLEPTIKRSRAAELLDKTVRTLARYEKQGILRPIKLNCRATVYLEADVRRLLNGDIVTARAHPQEPTLARAAGGTFAKRITPSAQ